MEYLCPLVRLSARKIWIAYLQAYMPHVSGEDSSNQPHHSPVPPTKAQYCPVPPRTAQYSPVKPITAHHKNIISFSNIKLSDFLLST